MLSVEVNGVNGLGVRAFSKGKAADKTPSPDFKVNHATSAKLSVTGVNSLNNVAELTLRSESITPRDFLKRLHSLMTKFLNGTEDHSSELERLSRAKVPDYNQGVQSVIKNIQLLLAAEAARY